MKVVKKQHEMQMALIEMADATEKPASAPARGRVDKTA
jgi:hypothetical protein